MKENLILPSLLILISLMQMIWSLQAVFKRTPRAVPFFLIGLQIFWPVMMVTEVLKIITTIRTGLPAYVFSLGAFILVRQKFFRDKKKFLCVGVNRENLRLTLLQSLQNLKIAFEVTANGFKLPATPGEIFLLETGSLGTALRFSSETSDKMLTSIKAETERVLQETRVNTDFKYYYLCIVLCLVTIALGSFVIYSQMYSPV